VLQPRGDRREALELARRHAEPLARVVAEAGEAELVVAAPGEEAVRERAEHQPAVGFLRGEPAQPAVEHERGVVRRERPSVGLGRDEEVGRDVHRRANNRRNACAWLVAV
jgi:hypothetical protein